MTIKFSDITGGGIPYGNNAGRPATPGIGKLYSNGEAQRLELYTAAGWSNIVQEVPAVSGIQGSYSEATNSGNITIIGTNFASGAIASAIGTNGAEITASSTTFNSIVQISAVFTGLSNAYEPYNIKVTNTSNLFGIMPNALYINASPVWTTASGSLGTFTEQISISVSATATDSDSTVTYALASGSTLPSGVTLNSSTGLISGTLPDITTDTTYSFTINATDGLNVIPRAFSITSKVITPTIDYLVLAGGGGGGGITVGGGGGAGGILTGTYTVGNTRSFSISVGQGGTGSQANGTDATNGSNSVLSGAGLSTITAIGGGAGGNHTGGSQPGGSRPTGNSGGSGGGGGDTSRAGGAGTSGQGNSGGSSGTQWRGGGGGGAGAAGASAGSSGPGGKGGDGIQSSITGVATYYAGGGGGASDNAGGAAGLGGGGAGGGNSPSTPPGSGTNGLGGGGGGARDNPSGGTGAPGGSGAIILAYPDTYAPIQTIPGTLTYDQPSRTGYRVYRFTAGSGTISI